MPQADRGVAAQRADRGGEDVPGQQHQGRAGDGVRRKGVERTNNVGDLLLSRGELPQSLVDVGVEGCAGGDSRDGLFESLYEIPLRRCTA